MANTAENERFAVEYGRQCLQERREDRTWRQGSRCLRGPPNPSQYSPCVFSTSDWNNYYMSLPLDYDIRNDPEFNLKRSSYWRLGDLGFSWPEPTTKEMLRTGYCGPDKNSLVRPAKLGLGLQKKDFRPEPAFRLHLTSDRSYLHIMRADPVEGVLPQGRQGDMANAKSVLHSDFKWRRKCCRPNQTETKSNQVEGKVDFERLAHRHIRNDLHREEYLDNHVIKFQDDARPNEPSSLMKLKRAYHWPTNPIDGGPLGGRIIFSQVDPCQTSRNRVWPCVEKKGLNWEPLVIPDEIESLLAPQVGKRESETAPKVNPKFNAAALDDLKLPQSNRECCPSRVTDLQRSCCTGQN